MIAESNGLGNYIREKRWRLVTPMAEFVSLCRNTRQYAEMEPSCGNE
jgi:hypothetical protein